MSIRSDAKEARDLDCPAQKTPGSGSGGERGPRDKKEQKEKKKRQQRGPAAARSKAEVGLG